MAEAKVYKIAEKPFGFPRQLRIVTIGAGASGINFARTLKNTLQEESFDHVIYEKNEEIGGTWFENRYPNCRCDVPSHSYQFTWRKNQAWSNFFAPAAEIHQYICEACVAEGLMPLIKTGHRVVEAQWSTDSCQWHLTIENEEKRFTDHADFLINAGGILNNWKWPDIPGLHQFQGGLIHSAQWPQDGSYNCSDKRVALIGNGATGVQMLPNIAQQTKNKRLYHFIRSPTWIIPPRVTTMRMSSPEVAAFLDTIEMDEKENFTPAQIQRFQTNPELLQKFYQVLDLDGALKSALSLDRNGPQQQWAAACCRKYMEVTLQNNEELCDKLIPNYPLGCRRITPAPGYLEALQLPHVQLLNGNDMKQVVKNGIELVSGELMEVDVIICATGFDSSFCPVFPLYGPSGNLQERWKKETPKSYLSLAVADMPNYFQFLGPNAPSAHGDMIGLSEHIADYVAKAIHKCQTEDIATICPKQEAVDDYFEHISTFMPRTAWAGACSSWYKPDRNNPELIVGLHPGSRGHFIEMLARFRGEDYSYTYTNPRQNRFSYLGNGLTRTEVALLEKMSS